MIRTIRRILASIILVISLGIILWASLPTQSQTISQVITPEMMQQKVGGTDMSLAAREVRLEWPKTMRIGERGTISLTFVPTEADPSIEKAAANYEDIYQNFRLMAEGRYEVAGMKVDPAIPRRKSMPAGQPLTFKWMVIASRPGAYDGTVWLSLRYLPLDGSQASEVPIYIHNIKIEADSILGMSKSSVYLVSGVGLVISAFLVYDDLVEAGRRLIRKVSKDKNDTRDTKDPMDIGLSNKIILEVKTNTEGFFSLTENGYA